MWRGDRMLNGLDEEIRQHIETETQENIERGMSPEEARYAALRKFGNVTRVKEETGEVWRVIWIEEFLQDVRYGFRALRNSPGFAAVAILTLALGIGANTAIFSLLDAVMLRSLPVTNPSELVLLKWTARNSPKIHGYMSSGDCPSDLRFGSANPSGCSFSEPMYRLIANSNQFSGTAAFANSGPLALTGTGPASMVSGQLVSGDFFKTLGIRTVAGRLIESSDDSLTAAPVAVLNFGYWQSAFGGNRDAIGRILELNGTPFTVVGVTEQKFNGITPGSDYDVWLPLAAGPKIIKPMFWNNREENPTFWWLTVLGRLKPDTSLPQVQAAISGSFRNELLYGAVPIFEPGGSVRPPSPAPAGGNPAPRQVIVGGPTPPRAGKGAAGNVAVLEPTPPTSDARKSPKTPDPAPVGINGALASNLNETANKTSSLSKPGDEPTITFLNAQKGLTGARRQFAQPLYVLMFSVGIILLIACSNVAGLLLARAAGRNREMALRLALGAGRTRIIRQLLTESLLLSATGGILGVVFAFWGIHTIVSFVSSNQSRPLAFATGLDTRVLLFTLAISVLTGILFGLAPALRSAGVDLMPALKEGTGGSAARISRWGKNFTVGNALVVTQVALAIVVLIGAGLLVRTLQNLRSIDVGFDSHNLVIFEIDPSLAGYKDEQIDSFYRDLRTRLEQTPGVRATSYSMFPMLSGSLSITGFHWPGTPQDRDSESDILTVGPNFLATMRIPLLMGREFDASDFELVAKNRAAPTVPKPVIVDQTFVTKFLGQENPMGKRFGETQGNEMEPPSAGYEIIGVVRDTKYSDLRREINPMMYVPQIGSGASFEVRTGGDPQALIPFIRATVSQLNPNLPLRNVTTESQQIDRLLFQERLVARLAGFFGVLALILACIGLYGLLAHEVARRTREIGVRVALGAQSAEVLTMVLRQGFALALAGIGLGIGVSLGVTRYLKSLLYEVSFNDPLTMGSACIVLILVALSACYIPARRATCVDPIISLRYE
jgi:predicted permease